MSIVPGGNPALWDNLYSVSVTITNTGSVAGAAIPQLYLGLPQPGNQDVTPVKVLRGFEKLMLQPGQSQTITFDLTRRDISYWDIYFQDWVIGTGSISVMAGFSSRDIQATTSFSPMSGTSSSGSGSGTGTGSGSSSVGSGSTASLTAASGTTAAPSPYVTQYSDGQPEVPVTEYSDGQPEAPVTEKSDGQPGASATATA